LRTVTTAHLNPACLAPSDGVDQETAAYGLLKAVLREERLISPDSSPLADRGTILAGYEHLLGAWTGSLDELPTDPESLLIRQAATHAEAMSPPDPPNTSRSIDEEARRNKGIRHAVSILAQLPRDQREAIDTDLRDLVQDRDEDVFGLIFQRGTTFTLRLRHRAPERLKAATERFVNVLAPRSETEIDDIVRHVNGLDRVIRSFDVAFRPIEMKTPAGEPAQTGHVHTVKSQLRLLLHLAVQPPQVYLVFLTIVLLAADLLLELRLIPDVSVRDLSLRGWSAGNLSRLGTGAFGAYLVALFLRFAELRGKLRASKRRHRWIGSRSTGYGAFIEWRTD
jgi:hypothetical protein